MPEASAPLRASTSSPDRVLIGCDFSSRPSRKKPVLIALGCLQRGRVVLSKLERFEDLATLGDWLAGRTVQQLGLTLVPPPSWLGAFDLPFGLPRELVQQLGWPMDWSACVQHYCSLTREDIRAQFKAFCDARPVGGKFAHRATDLPAGSSPSMKWVNPPVAYMMHAGLPLLLAAGAEMPGLWAGHGDPIESHKDGHKVALEAYPGLLAREVLGRTSYKSDDPKAHTPERLIARKDLIAALESGRTRLGLFLKLSHAQGDALVDDASGDSLDAVLCLVQAAWAHTRWLAGDALYGLPPGTDPLEGWIITAQQDGAASALVCRAEVHSQR